MNTSLQQVLCLVNLNVKRIARERLLVLLPVILAIIIGLACRFNKAGLPAGVMLVGVVTGVTVVRQLWIDRANRFSDCIQSAGVGARIQTIAAFVIWVITTGCLGSLVYVLTRL